MAGRGERGRQRIAGALAAAVLVVVGAGASSTARAQATFDNGTAKATSIVAKIAPGVGSLELGITSGVAVAETTNALAQAQAQSFDLGLIGLALTAENCEGNSDISPEDLPQPVRADNRNGDASAGRDGVPLADTALGGYRLLAEATTTPSSASSATGAASDLSPLLTIGGGQANAATAALAGAGREAFATADANIEIAGAVSLSGLRWEALHRTGAERVVAGSFDVGKAEIGGVPFPSDDLVALRDAVNTALAFSGVSVDFPRVEQLTEPIDLVRVTPLRVAMVDSPLGRLTLGQVLNATREQREQLFEDIVAFYCRAESALLTGDIFVSVFAGTGFFAVEIGGAEATSGEFTVAPPLEAPPGVAPGAPSPASAETAAPVPTPDAAAPPTPQAPAGPPADVVTSLLGDVARLHLVEFAALLVVADQPAVDVKPSRCDGFEVVDAA